jgi:hypothetical protein
MTQLAKQFETLKSKGVVFISIQASKMDPIVLDEWVKKNNIPYSAMIEGDNNKIRFSWGVRSLPWLILTDTQHTVVGSGFALNELDGKIKAAN